MTTTPPGWYDDGQGSLRWWDGSAWTEHVHEADAASAAAADIAPDARVAAVPVAAASEQPSAQLQGQTPARDTDGIAALGLAATGKPEAAAAPGAYPSAPYGYGPPAPGYPGTATQDVPPKRSRWWIWVAAGAAVLAALIVLAVILVPLALRAILGGGAPDEQAAVQAVEDYDRAWQSADCDLMLSVTTDDFREYYDLVDCATFQEQAQELGDTTDDYSVEITSVSAGEDGTVTVETAETYTSRVDRNGEDTGVVEPYTDNYTYVVVPSEGAWLIDDAALE